MSGRVLDWDVKNQSKQIMLSAAVIFGALGLIVFQEIISYI